MILVFAGAGASYAICPDLYPTMDKFPDRLSPYVKSHSWYDAAVKYLKSRHEPINIEVVLKLLDEIREYCDNSTPVGSFAGWVLRERLESLKPALQTRLNRLDLKEFFTQLQITKRELDELSKVIYTDLYRCYSPQPPSSRLKDWITLLEAIASPCGGLEIFTTNYDRVLEEVINESQQLVRNVPNEREAKDRVLGRRYDGREPWIDLCYWCPSHSLPEGNRVRLTKLHGSVDWQRESPYIALDNAAAEATDRLLRGETGGMQSIERKILISRPNDTSSRYSDVLIYPGFKGESQDEPFVTFRDHFHRVVKEAKAAIFIGYSFRDKYIKDILSDLPEGIPKYIIDKQERPPNQAFLRDAAHFRDGFTQESVTACIDSLKEHGLIF